MVGRVRFTLLVCSTVALPATTRELRHDESSHSLRQERYGHGASRDSCRYEYNEPYNGDGCYALRFGYVTVVVNGCHVRFTSETLHHGWFTRRRAREASRALPRQDGCQLMTAYFITTLATGANGYCEVAPPRAFHHIVAAVTALFDECETLLRLEEYL